MHRRQTWILITLLGSSLCSGQWLNYPNPGTPRTKDGKPNLAAPAPKARDGKPDLSGIWQAQASPIPELMRLLPGGTNGLGEDIPTKYFIDILADFTPQNSPLRNPPASGSLSLTSARKDDPGINCYPLSVPMVDTVPTPFKLIQTPELIMMLVESNTSFRQIFTDGRKLPDDPQPSWLGYSVGKWEGDWMVIDSLGFNDRSWLDAVGHTHSEDLRVNERFRRRDFGHLDIQITLNDAKTFTKPFTVSFTAELRPDSDLLESYCSENEKDLEHMIAK